MSKIRPEYYVNLKGKMYPTWPGVLVALHENGLIGIEVTPLQFPTEENNFTAICQAVVTMRGEDGSERRFVEVGDASPKTCSPLIALAALRMAATRAKGRAGRDAIACGETLREEIPDDEMVEERQPAHAAPRYGAAPAVVSGGVRAAEDPGAPEARPAKHAQQCEWKSPTGDPCGKFLTGKQCAESHAEFDHYLCPAHSQQLRQVRWAKAAKTAEAAETSPTTA